MSTDEADAKANSGDLPWSMDRSYAPKVTIFGAGIAGLTAAHELAERGFQVRVIERDAGLDKRGVTRMAVGGVARTQYALATKITDRDAWAERWCKGDRADSSQELTSEWLAPSAEAGFSFTDDDLLDPDNAKQLDAALGLKGALSIDGSAFIDVYFDPSQGQAGLESAEKRSEAISRLMQDLKLNPDRIHIQHKAKLGFDPMTFDPKRPRSSGEEAGAPPSIRAKLAAGGLAIEDEGGIEGWLEEVFKRAAPTVEISLTAFAEGASDRLAEERLLAVKAWLRGAVARLVEPDDSRPAGRTRSLRLRGEVKVGAEQDAGFVELRDLSARLEGALPDRKDDVHIALDGRHIVRIPFKAGEDAIDEPAVKQRIEELVSLLGAMEEASRGAFALYQPTIKIIARGASDASGDLQAARAEGAGGHEDLGRRRLTRVRELIEAKLARSERRSLLQGSRLAIQLQLTPALGALSAPPSPSVDEVIVRAHATPLAPIAVEFEEGSAKIKGDLARLATSLRRLRGRLKKAEASFHISITGYIDPEQDGPIPMEDAAKSLADRRAMVIERIAREIFGSSTSVSPFAARPAERAPRILSDWDDPQSAVTHNRLAILDVHFTVLPGEHGFRFFPSYYNHVFDTMRRIPLLDEDGNETGHTVYDNVIPTPNQGVAQRGFSPLILPRSPPDSAYERKERFAVLREMGYSTLDVTQFLLRTLRYMCTCSKRRATELEGISWWEYLQGYDPKTGSRRYTYTTRFTRDITTQSRTLASFDAVWGDARTCGNTWIQLAYNWLKPTAKVDGTLNGPTSEAWFDPWKTFLERRLGVQFVNGELLELHLKDMDDTRPVVTAKVSIPPGAAETTEEADYFVVALDARAAEGATEKLFLYSGKVGQIGVLSGLDGFTTRVRPEPPDQGPGRVRTPGGKYGLAKWDRFQTMSGVQFFFKQEFKLNDGYVYFNKAAWALTSINSAQFWQRRPTFERDGFVSVLSVDICDWNESAVRGPLIGKSAWECAGPAIAEEVWRQIEHELRISVEAKRPGEESSEIWETGRPPKPAWFHFDTNIEFGAVGEAKDLPVNNRAPYLVPIKGDWQSRPGSRPWDPSPAVVNLPPDYPQDTRKPGEWQADHGGYLVHWDKLVFAGVYLKTFTRMSTMEAANESGRHAVNAILDHYLSTHPGDQPERLRKTRARAGAREWVERSTEARHMKSAVFYTATRAGDYCKIWDPEHWEIPDLVQAKMQDEWCFDHGLPHPWDLWGVETIPALLSQAFNAGAYPAPASGSGASSPDSLEAALEPILRAVYPAGGWGSILQALRSYRLAIDEQMRRASASERGEPGT
jgi:uncharacterized protein with NAD-binding domain and iron-sulfur cluster